VTHLTEKPHSAIRSYVLRTGRKTPAQNKALESLLPLYGLKTTDFSSIQSIFKNSHPVILEIGFGNGDALYELAAKNPQKNFIGIEVHTPGVGRLLNNIHDNELTNVRVFNGDAALIINHEIPASTLDIINIWFPDPWHKKKHHKRRLIQTSFVKTLSEKLKPAGRLHLATDWQDYAEQMMTILEAEASLKNTAGEHQYSTPHWRPETRFQRRGIKLGHAVRDLIFEKIQP
jgi:tRNA (guanine-N7-)-methyltransferase